MRGKTSSDTSTQRNRVFPSAAAAQGTRLAPLHTRMPRVASSSLMHESTIHGYTSPKEGPCNERARRRQDPVDLMPPRSMNANPRQGAHTDLTTRLSGR